MKNRILYIIFGSCFLLLPHKMLAWGQQGHRIVGELAYSMLSCKTKKNVDRVLPNNSVAMVSNWADEVKADTSFDGIRDWHYTNFRGGLMRPEFDSVAMDTTNGKCIYYVTNLVEYLKLHPSDSYRLKILIHIVGDMFQPLHLGRAEDEGGNRITVKFFGQNTNLHHLWDNKLIGSKNLSYTEYTDYLKKAYRPKKTKYSQNLILDNAWRNYSIANKIYDTADGTSKSYLYIYNFEHIWEQQLVGGAILLATILDYIY